MRTKVRQWGNIKYLQYELRKNSGRGAEKGASVIFAIDDKYKDGLNKQFQPATYNELYEAFCKTYQCHGDGQGYYIFGEEEVVPTDLAVPAALARPTLAIKGGFNDRKV